MKHETKSPSATETEVKGPDAAHESEDGCRSTPSGSRGIKGQSLVDRKGRPLSQSFSGEERTRKIKQLETAYRRGKEVFLARKQLNDSVRDLRKALLAIEKLEGLGDYARSKTRLAFQKNFDEACRPAGALGELYWGQFSDGTAEAIGEKLVEYAWSEAPLHYKDWEEAFVQSPHLAERLSIRGSELHAVRRYPKPVVSEAIGKEAETLQRRERARKNRKQKRSTRGDP